MSEQDKYEQEVRRIAKILLRVDWPDEDCAMPDEIHINAYMPTARAMVAEMAKQYEHAYFSNYNGDEDSPDYELWNQNCIYEMQERGLIPSPSKATGSDTGKK